MRAKIMIEDQKALALKLTANGGNNSQQCWELLTKMLRPFARCLTLCFGQVSSHR